MAAHDPLTGVNAHTFQATTRAETNGAAAVRFRHCFRSYPFGPGWSHQGCSIYKTTEQREIPENDVAPEHTNDLPAEPAVVTAYGEGAQGWTRSVVRNLARGAPGRASHQVGMS